MVCQALFYKHFIGINSILTTNLQGGFYLPPFTDEQTKAQGGKVHEFTQRVEQGLQPG